MASSQTHENTRNHSESLKPSHFAIVSHQLPLFYSFARNVPNIELTVYEKERLIGGTCFETNVDWSGFYASGPEILAYLNQVVEKPRGMRRRANDTSGSGVMDTVTRRLRTWRTCFSWVLVSSIPGFGNFRGRVLHSAQWDVNEEGGWEEYVKDWGDKAIGIIGNSLVKSIVNYTLSKTWIGESFSLRTILELAGCDPGSDDYREAFRDEKYYKEFRHKVEADLDRSSGLTVYRAVLALSRSTIRRLLSSSYTRSRLLGSSMHGKYDTPDDTNHTHHTYRASSLKTEVLNTSTDGLALNADWVATGGAEAYLFIAMDGFPNLFVGGGPNLGVEYVVSASLKLQCERLKSIEVKRVAVDDWRAYMETFFPKIVVVRWYKKAEDRVIALWSVAWYLDENELDYLPGKPT
ncbi:hypothetical protein B0F90DRAFT_1671498 [Multifurca ochricompacta]|uniref:Uncharacterized protein n=1 Tax=Multifurca ochricompacta TaxID=376703 RepID=A0AAD4LUS3_9AGAM|nr:hypothetical protein B0F90DRAFT_1671498 [Multifurca ochricompacta]